MLGSEMNDAFFFDGDIIQTITNNNGGVNGGITNGMPVVMRCAFKPTSSIYSKQETVNLKTKENVELEITGRHDPCIVPRAVPVVESAMAIVLLDLLEQSSKGL
jgi:chorismate synthase